MFLPVTVSLTSRSKLIWFLSRESDWQLKLIRKFWFEALTHSRSSKKSSRHSGMKLGRFWVFVSVLLLQELRNGMHPDFCWVICSFQFFFSICSCQKPYSNYDTALGNVCLKFQQILCSYSQSESCYFLGLSLWVSTQSISIIGHH